MSFIVTLRMARKLVQLKYLTRRKGFTGLEFCALGSRYSGEINCGGTVWRNLIL